MATISLTLPVSGTVVAAGLHATNYTAIQGAINGGLDDNNIAAGAGIVGSKLRPTRVATTVAGLGSAADGATGLIRAGTTPFAFIPVVYDGTYGKWVSSPVVGFQSSALADTTTSLTYIDLSDRIYIGGFKALYDAGLRPFVRVAAPMSNNTGGDGVSIIAYVSEYNDGDGTTTAITGAATPDPTLTMVGTTSIFKMSNWVGFGAWGTAPAKAHAIIIVQHKAVTGGTATSSQRAIHLRWEG